MQDCGGFAQDCGGSAQDCGGYAQDYGVYAQGCEGYLFFKVYFCEMYPTCVSSKLCEFIPPSAVVSNLDARSAAVGRCPWRSWPTDSTFLL